MKHPLNGTTAICGLGMTEMGRVYRDAEDFAIDAVHLALQDCGLNKSELDGVMFSPGLSAGVDMSLQSKLGIDNLNLYTKIEAYGSTAGQMIGYAALAVSCGLANYVCCVFSDAPLSQGKRSGAIYERGLTPKSPFDLLNPLYGFVGGIPIYALSAQRHMDIYGTTQQQLGEIVISQRQWASMNPLACKRELLTMDDYFSSPWVVEPFHVLDCCQVTNGGIAVVVTSSERAQDLRQPPVYIRGIGQGHKDSTSTTTDVALRSAAEISAPRAFQMADASVKDVTQCQLYDCYSYTVLTTLEDYGFCKKGEGGAFVEGGRLAPGGSLPTNTGGGQLSSYYMWGMTPISEAVIQGRGHAGERQVANELIMVSGNGGLLANHATLLLSMDDA